MERSDTLPLFSYMNDGGSFEGLLHDSSFIERFNTKDVQEILSSSDDQSVVSPALDVWKNLDSDSNSLIGDIQIDTLTQDQVIPAKKKILQIGESLYMIGEDEVILKEEEGNQDLKDAVVVMNGASPIIGTPSLSLQPWQGDFDFSVDVETSSHSNSNWAFSKLLKKLFLKPFEAVPIDVKVSAWFDGYINITPVYTSSQHHSQPVTRCHNHKLMDQEKQIPFFEHIVQVNNSDAEYRLDERRHSVDIPLGVPAPGVHSKLLYVKCGCWNTCAGGPSRKPFCLVFTLFNSVGEEIGRQILDLKVCACPVRDCGYSEKRHHLRTNPGKIAAKTGKKKAIVQKKKITTTVNKGIKKIKVEPQQHKFELISVPVDLAGDVKRYVNQLIAEKYAKENNLCLPFPGN